MENILQYSEVIIAVLLSLIVLIQNKNVNLNLASMSGWMWTITRRWPEKVLYNITILLWTLFILNSIALYVINA